MKNKCIFGFIAGLLLFMVACGKPKEEPAQETVVDSTAVMTEMTEADFVTIYSSLMLAGAIENSREKETQNNMALADTLAAYGYSADAFDRFIGQLWRDPMRWDRLMTEIEEKVLEKQ